MVDRTVVVGVTVRQPDRVVRQAARFARAFGARLVCAQVDSGSYVINEYPDGSIESRPIDPDLLEWDPPDFDAELARHIEEWVGNEGVAVEFRVLAGDVAQALGRLAEVVGADLIVVGSRRAGLRSSMSEFFGGSVAAQLAHRQSRPVVVVPVNLAREGALPWEPQ